MKLQLLLAFASFLVPSEPTCSDQERQMLRGVAKRQMGYQLIYAVDDTFSSRNALNVVFEYLKYSSWNLRIPFIFHKGQVKELYFQTIQATGFCPSETSYDRTNGLILSNKTTFGVFYGCNLYNFIESIYIITNEGHPFLKKDERVLINRDFNAKFCKCRQIHEEFTKSCLGLSNTNLGMLVLLSCIAVILVFLLGLKSFVSNRVAPDAVTAFSD